MAIKNQCVATVEVLINLRIDINAQNNVSKLLNDYTINPICITVYTVNARYT